MDNLLYFFSNLIENNFWMAPLAAFIAGMLVSLTPCSISTIPLVISVVGGTGTRNTKRAFYLSLLYAAGTAITFTIMGTLASLMGNLIGISAGWWYVLLGILMVLMALQTWEIYNFIPATYLVSKNKKRGYLGAFIAGIMAGVFSSPCSTPVLIALITVVAGKGDVVWGVVLFLMYSIGHGILSIVAGTSVGFVGRLTADERYGKFSKALKIVLGTVIMAIAFYMFYLGF